MSRKVKSAGFDSSKDGDERKDPAYFPNMTFAPDSFKYVGDCSKLDPMTRGMGRSVVDNVKERLAELKKKKLVPETYTIHNSVHVLPERVLDTTDRSSVLCAEIGGFDKSGFAEGDPLRKAIYYTNPYMTCRWCNLLSYVDVKSIRWMIAAGIDPSGHGKLHTAAGIDPSGHGKLHTRNAPSSATLRAATGAAERNGAASASGSALASGSCPGTVPGSVSGLRRIDTEVPYYGNEEEDEEEGVKIGSFAVSFDAQDGQFVDTPLLENEMDQFNILFGQSSASTAAISDAVASAGIRLGDPGGMRDSIRGDGSRYSKLASASPSRIPSLNASRANSVAPTRRGSPNTSSVPSRTTSAARTRTAVAEASAQHVMPGTADSTNSSSSSKSTAEDKKKQNLALQNIEGLPACRRCGRTDMFVIGPQDYREEIAARKKVEREKKAKINGACRVIQRSYRAYVRRMYATAAARARKALEMLQYQASTQICRIARGRLARRVFATEKCLAVIKDAHPILLAYALRKRQKDSNAKAVFWYKRMDEEKLLYQDYVLLCARTGFQPPRVMVEENILEIFTRIMIRKDELVTTVEKRWRGLMCRRIVVFFRTELVRLRNWVFSRVLKIQRIYRGHVGRLIMRSFKAKLTYEDRMSKYRSDMHYARIEENRKYSSLVLKSKYAKERDIEFSARALSRLEDCDESTEWKGKRFACYDASTYADPKLNTQIGVHIAIEKEYQGMKNEEIGGENKRKWFINSRINETGPTHYGFRSMKPNEVEALKEAAVKLAKEQRAREELLIREQAEAEITDYLEENEYESMTEQERKKLIEDRLNKFQNSKSMSRVREEAEEEEMRLTKESKKVICGMEFEDVESARSKAMRIYFQGELSDLTNKVIERSIHDHTRRNLLGRFKEYNANKRLSDRAIELQFDELCRKEDEKAELARQLRIEGGYAALDYDNGELSGRDVPVVIAPVDKSKLKPIAIEKNIRSSLRANKLVNPRLRKLNEKQLTDLKKISGVIEEDNEDDNDVSVGDSGDVSVTSSKKSSPSSSTSTKKSQESEFAVQRKILASKKKKLAESKGGKKKEQFAYRPYQFPSNINEKPMEWLLGDIDFL